MDAPDKIYIAEHNANVPTGYFSRNRDGVFTQEYIRKDIVDDMLKTAEDHAYLAGAVNEREKMLKDAVEGKIAERVQGKLYARCQVPINMGFEFGDKVRVVVLKAEEE